jgi:hypothetical protein
VSNLERCIKCDALTGRAGRADDSLFCGCCDMGPLCSGCWDEHTCQELVDQLRAEVERLHLLIDDVCCRDWTDPQPEDHAAMRELHGAVKADRKAGGEG